MENYNWSKFTILIPVNAGLESWFLRSAEFTKPLNQPWNFNTIIEKRNQQAKLLI